MTGSICEQHEHAELSDAHAVLSEQLLQHRDVEQQAEQQNGAGNDDPDLFIESQLGDVLTLLAHRGRLHSSWSSRRVRESSYQPASVRLLWFRQMRHDGALLSGPRYADGPCLPSPS